MPMPTIRPMTVADHPALVALLQQTPGVSLREADSLAATARYLGRNPGLSFVAERDGAIVGCLLGGHDGRRGYLQHLLVVPALRRSDLATRLVDRCLDALAREGIRKSHVDVFTDNATGNAFWLATGWTLRSDIHRYSRIRVGGADT